MNNFHRVVARLQGFGHLNTALGEVGFLQGLVVVEVLGIGVPS